MRRQYAWRSYSLAILMAMIGLLIPVQIIRIQTSQDVDDLIAQGNRYAGYYHTYYPKRGEIYDRSGHLLAGNKTVFEIGVDLRNPYIDAHTIALTLSVHLGLDYNGLFENLENPKEGEYYIVIEDFVPATVADELEALKAKLEEDAEVNNESHLGTLTGLEFKEHLQRSYPEGSLASNVIGFVTLEGRGYFGVEEKYNNLLSGEPKTVWVPSDPNRALEIPNVQDGTTLILTIDRELQASVENILDKALYTYGAENGSILVMNPGNGEILAMASTPRMNLNEFWNYEAIYDNASEFNRPISMPYEPGSTLKILTAAAALDNGTVRPDTTFIDTGVYNASGATIRNWDEKAWGEQTITGCLQHSLNVCLAWIANEMGASSFYDYMQVFGLGHPTGVDLAGEAAGRLKIPGDADWYPVDLSTNAFGQGVSATPIQIMMAASSIANEGKMVTPHVLQAMVQNNQQYNSSPQNAGSPISAETAQTLSEMLAVALENESSMALLPGYRLAGKTGTAQIPNKNGYYEYGTTNASFIGWGPVDDPQFMVYVWLEKPSSSIWGSETAAPVFALVAQDTVIALNIPPDNIRRQISAGR